MSEDCLIPQSYLTNITTERIKEALKELKKSAKTEFQRIRKETPSYSNGLAHGFWIQQLVNAELFSKSVVRFVF